MPVQPVPTLSDIPPFPALSDRAAGTYNSMAFNFATHMADNFNGEMTAVAENVRNNALEAESKAATATSAAQQATSAAADVVALVGVNPWVSGTNYAKNVAVISQVNFQTYRRRAAGAGTTDPANDPTNWAILTGDGAFIPQVVVASSIDLAAGNYHTRTMTASQAFTFDNCPSDGFSFTLELTVTSGVVTLPTSVRTPSDTPYTLAAGKTHLLMFVTSNRGVRWRLAAATNYAT